LATETGESFQFVASQAHLHWDPTRTDVKLAQLGALLKATESCVAARQTKMVGQRTLPVVVAGDLNSLPSSPQLRLCFSGRAGIEPRYAAALGVDLGCHQDPPRSAAAGGRQRRRRRPPSEVKVAVDFNLNRLCRWLRLCGVDTIIESPEEAELRCKGKAMALATKAANEGRLLVTSSKQLVARREVANLPYVHVASTSSTEDAFLAVVKDARAHLTESDALSRCVRCNGLIAEADERRAEAIRATDPDRTKLPHDPKVQLYECVGCSQIFWWSERGTSSAARAKHLADRLRHLADDQDATTAALEEEEEEEKANNNNNREQEDDGGSSDVLIRSLVAGLRHGLGNLRSAMPVGERNGVVSNYVPDFHGQIDYLLYTERHWTLRRRRRLPTRLDLQQALGSKKVFLPCRSWPSDHIAVVADLAPTIPLSSSSSSS